MNRFRIDSLPPHEIQSYIQNDSRILLPLFVTEPCGNLPLNVSAQITQNLSDQISETIGILQTAPIETGIVTPFRGSPGTFGMRRNTFSTFVADLARTLTSWGVTEIIFLESSVFLSPFIDAGLRHYRQKLPVNFRWKTITWQNHQLMRKIVSTHFENLHELWRSEAALHLLWHEITGEAIPQKSDISIDAQAFKQWKRRGMDPEKLRKISPTYIFSSWTDFTPAKEVFIPQLVQVLTTELNAEYHK